MARPKKEVEEGKTLEKPSPKPSPTSQKPILSASLANPFDLLDEDFSDLIGIVDANEDDVFVAAEKKKIENEKKAQREAKIKVREEEEKAAREARKRAIQEKKAHDASILRLHRARPRPIFSRGPKSDLADDELTKNSSGVELQDKESQGDVVEKDVAEIALVKEVASFCLEDADFPILGKQVQAVTPLAREAVAGKTVVEKTPQEKL